MVPSGHLLPLLLLLLLPAAIADVDWIEVSEAPRNKSVQYMGRFAVLVRNKERFKLNNNTADVSFCQTATAYVKTVFADDHGHRKYIYDLGIVANRRGTSVKPTFLATVSVQVYLGELEYYYDLLRFFPYPVPVDGNAVVCTNFND